MTVMVFWVLKEKICTLWCLSFLWATEKESTAGRDALWLEHTEQPLWRPQFFYSAYTKWKTYRINIIEIRLFFCAVSDEYVISEPLSSLINIQRTRCVLLLAYEKQASLTYKRSLGFICIGFIDTVPFENILWNIPMYTYIYRKELWVHLYIVHTKTDIHSFST